MKVNYRVQSFTILEVTIAMLLVAIIASFAFYTLNIFVRLSQEQQIKKIKKYSLELFMHRLNVDWNQAITILYEDNYNLLSLKDSIGTINYTFSDSLILRNQYNLRTDSFFFDISILSTKNLKRNNHDTGFLYNLKGTILHNQEDIPIVLYKEYTASQIINYSIDMNNHVTN